MNKYNDLEITIQTIDNQEIYKQILPSLQLIYNPYEFKIIHNMYEFKLSNQNDEDKLNNLLKKEELDLLIEFLIDLIQSF